MLVERGEWGDFLHNKTLHKLNFHPRYKEVIRLTQSKSQ